MRKIIHVDMDAFYASVEQRDFPELAGKPVAVGGTTSRGVVAAASYEARVYGIHSAMPSVVARRKCPDLIFVRPRFDVYRAVSRQIRAVFSQYTDLIEPLSLDEAYLDVTHPRQGPPSATLIAQAIKDDILEETGLTASAGVSFNKFLAKVASDVDKPNGLTVILPDEAADFLDRLPIEKFYGIGPVTAEKMRRLGIHNGSDLRQWPEQGLVEHFGKAGGHFYRIAHARDDRPVQSERVRKSIGAERTFDYDIREVREMHARLEDITQRVAERMKQYDVVGRTVTLKLKYHDFILRTRSTTMQHLVAGAADLQAIADRLLHEPAPPDRAVRLLGLTVSNLLPASAGSGLPTQLAFDFEDKA